MLRKRVSKNAEVLKALVSKLLVTSFADDSGAGDDGSKQVQVVNYEELIAKARKEEKNKLYPEIDRYKRLFEDMTRQNNDNIIKIGTLEKKIEELEANKSSGVSDEEVTKLNNRIAELEAEVKKYEEQDNGEAPNEEELRESIRAELEAEFNVKLYRTEKLASDDVKKAVLPMFFDGITGTTSEEIDKSIEEAIEKTKIAKEQLGIKDTESDSDSDEEENNDKEKKKDDGGSNRPPKASTNAIKLGKSKYTAEDIQNLDPNSDEYKQLRRDLGLK